MSEAPAIPERRLVSASSRWPRLSVIALCRWQVRRSWIVRAASGVAWVVAAAGAWAVIRAQADVAELIRPALRALVWIGLGPVALVMAHDPEGKDLTEGVADMLACRGVGRGELRRARLLASVLEAIRLLGLPALLLSAAVFYHGVHARAAGLVVGILGVCLLTGGVVGFLASACGHLAGRRGPGWMAALVIIPWLLADGFGDGLSLPTLIDAWLTRLVSAT
jgi:hypothetical protein